MRTANNRNALTRMGSGAFVVMRYNHQCEHSGRARMGSGASVPVMVALLVSRSPGTGTVCENAIPQELPLLNRATRPEKQRKHDKVNGHIFAAAK